MNNKFLIKLLKKQIKKIKLMSLEKNNPDDFTQWKNETLLILRDTEYKHSHLYEKLNEIEFQRSISFWTEEEKKITIKMIEEGSHNSINFLKEIINEVELEISSEKQPNIKSQFIYGIIIPIILIILTISSYPWWWPFITHSLDNNIKECSLTIIPDRYRIDIRKNGTILDTLKLNIYADSCNFILRDDFQVKNLRFNNEDYFYKDAILEPSFVVSDIIYYSPLIKGKRTIDSLAIEIKRDILFDGYKVAWFENNDKTQIGDFWLEYSYQINNQTIRDSSNVGIYLITSNN